ncbi:MAG: phage virion morphogenesis protein [Peptococcaceae bacterium]|nr:phage virion morphogenesis protein [Peptococcaceae bacterium]
MGDYSIRLEGDVRDLRKKLGRLQLSGAEKTSLNLALAETLRESTMTRFDTGTGPDGRKWKKSIRAEAEGGQTLVNTADLKNSIHAMASDTAAAVGTNKKYARTHQFGDSRTIRTKRKKSLAFRIGGKWIVRKQVHVTIPARPFLGITDEDMTEIRATVAEFIKDR